VVIQRGNERKKAALVKGRLLAKSSGEEGKLFTSKAEPGLLPAAAS
jgi:hypothetical protein